MRATPPAAAAVLRALAARGAQPIELAFGRWLAGLDPDRAAPLALTGALLARARTDGHAGVALGRWAGHPYPDDPDTEGAAFSASPEPAHYTLPERSVWDAALAASPLVGPPGVQGSDREKGEEEDEMTAATPLVLDGDTLYVHALWRAERRAARRLRARLAQPHPLAPPEALRTAFGRLFPDAGPSGAGPDLQAAACAAALRHRLAVMAGGPGTGKTFTAARLLALARVARPGLAIALAAPTGKAAQRLQASLDAQRADLDRALGDAAPAGGALGALPAALTLHRLLGADARGRFHRTADAPLPADLVLVDEASMLDLPLLDALLDALRLDARLVLLGDADQLAAVGAGAAFADLCRLGDGPPTPAFAAFCAALGATPPASDAPATPAASSATDAVVRLTRSRRFDPDAGIGALAAALREGDGAAALAVLADPAQPEATLALPTSDAALEDALPHARTVVSAPSPEAALAALGRFQLLAATRGGPLGVRALNRAVEAALRLERSIGPGLHYDGRPVLVTRNDPASGLANGDLGVGCTAGGAPAVAFPGEGGVRLVPLARLPEHETAWAMTIHKSQGSEFDQVAVALPADRPDRLSRELLYTAVTRARAAVTVLAEEGAVRLAAAAPEDRHGRLLDRLQEDDLL